MKSGRELSCKALRKYFFAYTFPHFAWLFQLFPLLPESQQNILQQKFRVGLRLVHRCPFVSAHNLFNVTSEQPLEFYIKKYIQRRLKTMFTTDLGSSLFYEDIFGWDTFCKRKNDRLGHFFCSRRVRQLKDRHESFLLKWLSFVDAN